MGNIEKFSAIERKMLLETIRVEHPYFRKGMEKILSCLEVSKYSTEPKSLFVVGEAGTGKTELFKAFCKLNDQVNMVEEEGEIIRKKKIIHIRLPYPASISGIVYRMLSDLGDEFPGSGKNDNQRTERLIYFIKKCGVEMICFDEFQNFVDRDKIKTLKAGAEWVKNLINDTNVPFVFFGTQASRSIISANERQLERRAENEHTMKRYGYNNMKERKLFSQMLNKIEELLPFDGSSDLYEPEIAERIYAATNGLIHSIMSLITAAGRYAIDEEVDSISLKHLHRAFRNNKYLQSNIDRNPFDPEFIKKLDIERSNEVS